MIASFPEIASNAMPIFAAKTSVPVGRTKHKIRIDRFQVHITPVWALTDYKVQGSTYSKATLDLHYRQRAKGHSTHKRYTSTYVQLSRVRSLAGVSLLSKISLDDVGNKPHKLLLKEDLRIQQLASATEKRWAQIEAQEGF